MMRIMTKSLPDYFSYPNGTLRPMRREDISTLVPIINEAYAYQDAAKGSPRTSAAHLTERAHQADFYVLTIDEQLSGCFYIEKVKNALHFGLLTLIPGARGKGIGTLIIAALTDYAKSVGLSTLELDYMSVASWLKRYYEKSGFTETGQITPWGSIDLVRMSKELK